MREGVEDALVLGLETGVFAAREAVQALGRDAFLDGLLDVRVPGGLAVEVAAA